MRSVTVADFVGWREAARALLSHEIHPAEVIWNGERAQAGLFAADPLPPLGAVRHAVSKSFLSLAEFVAHHRQPERWSLLYHMLWRLTHGEKHLLRIATDPLTEALRLMEKSVRRDVHKTKAFVRFRRVAGEGGQEHFIAWHRPDHPILRLAAPFFQRRFTGMRWTILTPDESANWDGEALTYGPGATRDEAPGEDMLEDLWRDYYRAIFNPARISIPAMKKEMPVRHWATLPEAEIIHELLQQAPARVAEMIARQEGSAVTAADFLPPQRDIASLREAAEICRGCDLYQCATQVVFGEGPLNAKLVLVGEQPGDEEDKTGRPFVGPAGKMLDKAMAEAGLDRSRLYVTNAVKHFKFEQRGSLRMHRTPSLREITGCRPWLEAEIRALTPKGIVCLGGTAARSLISHGFTLKNNHGKWLEGHDVPMLATYHPSAILRMPDKAMRHKLFDTLVSDLAVAAQVA